MIEIWGKPNCPQCDQAKRICEKYELKYKYLTIDKDFTREEILETFPGARTFPQIKVNGTAIGGHEQLAAYLEETGYNGTGHTL